MTRRDGPAPRPRRGERGLASHEWLLLIAAVASFTALAVFVLAETVDDAAARAGADDLARLASARRDAALIENEAVTIVPAEWRMVSWGEWADHFAKRCRNIHYAYRAHGYTVVTAFKPPVRLSESDPIIKESEESDRMIERGSSPREFKPRVAKALARADADPPTTGKPQVQCEVPSP